MIIQGKKFKNPKELEDFFWENNPEEISWSEVREINSELFWLLCEVADQLVASGKIKLHNHPLYRGN